MKRLGDAWRPSAESLQRWWPLTDVTVGAPQRAVAGVRAVGMVESSEGSFVYKIADASRTPAALHRSLSVFDLLPAGGFHEIPGLLRTRLGQPFAALEGRCTHILRHIVGSVPEPTPETYRALGRLAAALHSVHSPLPETDFRPSSIIRTDLPMIADSLAFGSEYLALCRSLPGFDGLPRAAIHTDLAPTNVIRRPDGTLVLVDLDDLGMGPRVLDIAFPLIQQFVSENCTVQHENARAFYRSYSARILLTPEEQEAIFPAALFLALMYLPFGNREARWRRIRWAIDHRAELDRLHRG